MKLGIDIDGVIADTRKVITRMFGEVFGKHYDPEELSDYDLSKYYGPTVWKHFRNMEGEFYSSVEPMSNSVKYLNKLIEGNKKIYIITARHQRNDTATLDWFKRHGINIDIDDVFFEKDKAELCKQLGIKVFVDDDPHNIKHLSNAGLKTIVFSQPYNQQLNIDNLEYVTNWEDLYSILHKI